MSSSLPRPSTFSSLLFTVVSAFVTVDPPLPVQPRNQKPNTKW